MEAFLFFCLLSCANIHAIYTDLWNVNSAETLTVSEGDNITLRCNITDHEEVAWYRLSFDALTLLISAQKTRTVKSLPVYYNKDERRFVLRPDKQITMAMFTILNLREDDLGLYFCGIAAEPAQMHFGRATRLQFKDETFSAENPAGEEAEKTGSVCERVLMFGGVGVAAMLLLLTTAVACSVIRHARERYHVK